MRNETQPTELLNVPGDAGAVMSTLDGHPLAEQGQASKALAVSAITPFFGGTVALMVFAFSTLAAMVGHNPAKTLIGAVLGLMIGFGVFGFVLRKLDFSLAPVILGVVLGGIFEENLRRALSISDGDWSILFHSPATIALWLLAVVILFLPPLLAKFKPGAVVESK